jgi:hypothetical protein
MNIYIDEYIFWKGVLMTGKRAFTESKNLWREPPLRLSAKSFSLRVKIKILGEEQTLSKKTLGEEFFAESISLTLGEEFFLKKITFSPPNFFLSSTCTYTNYMFKFDTILSLFAIFKNYTSF